MSDYRSVVVTITHAMSGTPPTGLRVISDGSETDAPAEASPDYLQLVASDPYWGNVGARVTASVRNPEIPLVTGGVA